MPQSVLNLFEDLDIVDVKRLVWYRPFGSNLIRNCCGELQSSLDQSPEPDEDSSMDIVGWRIHSGEDGKHRWQVRDDNVTGLYTKERQSNLKYKSESPNAEQVQITISLFRSENNLLLILIASPPILPIVKILQLQEHFFENSKPGSSRCFQTDIHRIPSQVPQKQN